MVAAQAVAVLSSIPDGLVSLVVGLWGVVLARWVFVNRENRRLPRRQPWHETLPLTLVAALVAAVVIVDRDMGLSMAAFTGLGVGWAAVLLLDILGDRVTAALKAGAGLPDPVKRADKSGHDGVVSSSLMQPDEGMLDSLDKLDKKE